MKDTIRTASYTINDANETSVNQTLNVIKKITTGRVSVEQIEQSNMLYIQFMNYYGFPDDYLLLKQMLIYSVLINYIETENKELLLPVKQNKLIAYNHNAVNLKEKFTEIYRQDSIQADADLQAIAPHESENIIKDLVYSYYSNPNAKVKNYEDLIEEVKVLGYKPEPYGHGTHPDCFFEFYVKFKYGREITVQTLVEMKSVLGEVKSDNSLNAKYNNATNCKQNVINDLEYFKNEELRKTVFQNPEMSKENFDKTKIFTTLTIFLHYLPQPDMNQISYYDFDLTWMPLTLEFDIESKTGKISDLIFRVKSNGENSQNNNVNLSLNIPGCVYPDQNILFDRLSLYLLGHTSEYEDHLELRSEGTINYLYSKCEVMSRMFNMLISLTSEYLDGFLDEIIERRAFIKHQRSLDCVKQCDDFRKEFIDEIFVKSGQFIKIIEDSIKFNELERSLNEIMKNIIDFSYTDFDNIYKEKRKEWNKLKGKENKYYNDKKDAINELLTVTFKNYKKEKKKAVNKKN